jgi:hypothetical protein
MISDILSLVILGLMMVLVIYPASHWLRHSWATRRSRARVDGGPPRGRL